MTFEPVPYDILEGFKHFLMAFGGIGVMITLLAMFITRLSIGPEGPQLVLTQIKEGWKDLLALSFRRIWAVSILTFKEASRKKVFYVVVMFAVLFMFANWFLSMQDQRAEFQIEVYITFVLTVIAFLITPIMLMLSCWGIPEDIRLRSLHTVVTKPARRLEIVVGRILGFVGIASLLVILMGAVGYVWIMRALPEDAASNITCRVPVYGELSFIDKEGNSATEGENTGDEWEFRSYIAGATKARAIWTFNDLDVSQFSRSEPVRMEARFEAFRTHKGTIGDTLFVEFTLVNNDTNKTARLDSFSIHEYTFDLIEIPVKLPVYDEKLEKSVEYDLFDDFLSAESLSVEVRCLDAGQYIGMAKPDLFLRLQDRSFATGYSKAIFGQWLLLVLMISISVAMSCIVKGPVATMTSAAILMVGFMFSGTLNEQVTGNAIGGGPLESMYRLLQGVNETSRLPQDDLVAIAALGMDPVFSNMLWVVKHVIPDVSSFSMSEYVAKGFDVNTSAAIYPSIAVTLSYFLVSVIVGYYCLKLRELEAK